MQQENLIKVLHRLKDSTSIEEKCIILTYINGFKGNSLTQKFTETQYIALCKSLVDMITSADRKFHIETIKKTFEIVLREFKNYEPILFEFVLRIERKKRLKFLRFLLSLNDTVLAQVLLDLRTVKFIKECMQDIQPSTMELLTRDTGVGNRKRTRKLTERDKLSLDQEFDRLILTTTIELLLRIYEHAAGDSLFHVNLFHIFILDKVAALAYMGESGQRNSALKLLRAAVVENLIPYMQSNNKVAWEQFKKQLEKNYCPRILRLIQLDNSDWSDLWRISMKTVDSDLQNDEKLFNKLLKIIEKAFKSTDLEIKKQAFENWKLVIDILTSDTSSLATSKRLNLLATPLTESSTRSEIIALSKIEVWWYLISKVYPHISNFTHELIEPFLVFCFKSLSLKKDDPTAATENFLKAKIAAIDALLQMLIIRQEDRFLIIPTLVERLPAALPNEAFCSCYAVLVQSFGEVVRVLTGIDEDVVPNGDRLNKILWSNLMDYALQSPPQHKKRVFKEMIAVTQNLIQHVHTSVMIGEFILNFVIPELVEVSDHLVYHDDTLIDFLLKLLCCPVLEKTVERNFDDIKVLIEQAIMLDNTSTYHPSVLVFVKTVLAEMELGVAGKVRPSCIAELWYTLAEVITKYMIDGQRINEGSHGTENGETILVLLNYPFKYDFWKNSGQMKIIDHWKSLYQQVYMQLNVRGIMPNNIIDGFLGTMGDCVSRNQQYCSFIVHFLPIIMEHIDYKCLPSNGELSLAITLLRDVSTHCLSQSQETEVELSLKSINLMLDNVYGLNVVNRTLSYLECLRPSIGIMLIQPLSESTGREVMEICECLVAIIQSYAGVLSYKFFSSYYDVIRLGLCHENFEICMKMRSLLEIQSEVKEDVRHLVVELEREVEKEIVVCWSATKKRKR